jgi:hypothetical protein
MPDSGFNQPLGTRRDNNTYDPNYLSGFQRYEGNLNQTNLGNMLELNHMNEMINMRNTMRENMMNMTRYR